MEATAEAMRMYTSLRAEVKKRKDSLKIHIIKMWKKRAQQRHHQVDRSTQEDGGKKNQNQKTAESGKPKMDLVISDLKFSTGVGRS